MFVAETNDFINKHIFRLFLYYFDIAPNNINYSHKYRCIY